MIELLLAAALLSGAPDDGLQAYKEGRYEDAVRILNGVPPSYDVRLTLGLALGRLERFPEAETAFDGAISLDPLRPEAWTEKGGLLFLQKDYAGAIEPLRRSLRLKEDAYTRDLLASCLFLSGRSDEALAEWNRLGKPVLRTLTISGLVSTKDVVARREVGMNEGAALDLADLQAARMRLREVGVFDRESLRISPVGDGSADLDVALVEKHGFGSLPSLALGLGMDALASKRVRLAYADLGGDGGRVSAQYRFQSTRPEVALSLDWPRPWGAPFYLHLGSFVGRQDYALPEGSFVRKGGGGVLSGRGVIGHRTVVEVGIVDRHRTFSAAEADAPPGTIVGIQTHVRESFVEGSRDRLSGNGNFFETVGALGSAIRYTSARIGLDYHRLLSNPEGTPLERSELAGQLQWGFGTTGVPIDEQFAPGGSPDMEYPLRAHAQDRNGILGVLPIGRSLLIGNAEWRRRLARWSLLSVGAILFYDGALISQTTAGVTRGYHDVGVGLRVAPPGGPILRVDYGHGLTDGANALFVGLGQVF